MLRVTEVTTPEGFASLHAPWNRCLATSSNNTVFLTWEWLYTWWEIYSSRKRLSILLFHDEGGELVGIAPFTLGLDGTCCYCDENDDNHSVPCTVARAALGYAALAETPGEPE